LFELRRNLPIYGSFSLPRPPKQKRLHGSTYRKHCKHKSFQIYSTQIVWSIFNKNKKVLLKWLHAIKHA